MSDHTELYKSLDIIFDRLVKLKYQETLGILSRADPEAEVLQIRNFLLILAEIVFTVYGYQLQTLLDGPVDNVESFVGQNLHHLNLQQRINLILEVIRQV